MNKKKLSMGRSARQNIVLLVILLALCIFFYTQSEKFLTMYNLMSMVRQNLPNLLLACSMMFVIASGAIDLSVGGMMGLSAIFFGYLCIWGVNPWLAIPIVLCLGVGVGVLNTVIMEKLKIPAIMATLATWIITAGLALAICNAIPISGPEVKPITALNSIKFAGGIPLALIIVVVVIAIFIFLEKKTLLGKYAIAIGGNDSAAYYAGINVFRMRMIFFILSGVMAAFSGIWQVGRIGSADPTIGVGMEFSVIAAVILGGVNIKGGEGTIAGVVLGTLILMILTNGMKMMNIDSFFQQVVTGIVLYVAVLVNSLGGNKKRIRRKVAVAKE
ncbi:MAG: ABC transporter permease [Christensenella sp.]|nr:ABC transporter permease [Christensenella sp.]